jgi:hypothetical protein
MTSQALLAVVLFLAPSTASATTAVRIFARDVSACASGTVRAEPVCEGCAAKAKVTPWTMTGGLADVQLELTDAAPQWRAQAHAEGCWSASVLLAANTESATLVVLPAARIAVAFAQPRGDRAPDVLQLRVGSVRVGEFPESLVDCVLNGGRWSCSVPATEVDLRLSANGFVPHYFWGVRPERGRTLGLGTLSLRRGGSVIGRATLSARETLPVDVTLAPRAYGGDDRKTLSLQTNARGFFQFRAVEPGEWDVIATSPGWSPARSSITVAEGAEIALPKPLLLEPLAALELRLEPAHDPGGAEWNVRLEQMPEWGQRLRVAEKAAVDGAWKAENLESGMYLITVTSADGAVVHQGGHVISHGMPPLPIRIDMIAVRGTVTSAGKPVQGRVEFLQAGGRKAAMQSDAAGTFAGYVPREARHAWTVRVTPGGSTAGVHVHDVEVKPVDGVARVEIELAEGRMSGTVVDESGNGVRASLRVHAPGVSVDARTASDGTFSISGLPRGTVEVQAQSEEGDSGFVKHTVGEDDEPLTIVAPRRLRVQATVVTPGGTPYAGALVRVVRSGRIIIDETTSPAGRFAIHSPARDPVAHVIVNAPGYAVAMRQVPLTGGDDTRRIVLSPRWGTVWVPAGEPEHWPVIGVVGMPALDLYNWLEPPPASFRHAVRGGRVLDLEPGAYRFCTDRSERVCVTHTVTPGSQYIVEFPQ